MNHYTIGILSHNISMRFSSGPQPDSSLDHNFHSFNDVLCTDVAPAGFLPTSQVGGWSLEQFRWGHCPLLCHRSLLGRCTQGGSSRDEGWWTGIQQQGDLQVTMRPWNMLLVGDQWTFVLEYSKNCVPFLQWPIACVLRGGVQGLKLNCYINSIDSFNSHELFFDSSGAPFEDYLKVDNETQKVGVNCELNAD
jgi:hypothetical protein